MNVEAVLHARECGPTHGESLHIVQVANFVTERSGGLRRALRELGKRYVAHGHRCTLIVPMQSAPQHLPSWLSTDGVRIVVVPGVRVPFAGGYRAIVRRRPLQRILATLQPSVVELSDKTSLSWLPVWLKGRGIPTVLVSHERHDVLLAEALPECIKWRRTIDHWIQRVGDSVDAIVCASTFAAEPFATWSDKVNIVPLGVDLALFAPRSQERKELPDHREEPITLVTVGRLSPEKRPGDAVAAASELQRRGHSVRLHIIGDGPMRERLQRQSSGLAVTFHGHIEDRSKLAELMRNADVAIAPCRIETFGLSILESMASGLPVVVPDGGAARELVSLGTGIVTRSNPQMMADAVEFLAAQARQLHTRRTLQVRCRTHAERYSWESAAGQLLRIHSGAVRRAESPFERVL